MAENFSIDGLKEINRTLSAIDKSLYPELVVALTDDAYANVKKGSKKHIQSGNLDDNIAFKVSRNRLTGEVFIEDNAMMVDWKGKKVNYALFVLFGSRPHPINPKHKKALRFSSVGKFVFAKGIKKHPGYKGDNFLHDGVQETFNKIDKIFQGMKSEYK